MWLEELHNKGWSRDKLEASVAWGFVSLVHALQFLGEAGLVHGNVSPSGVFVTSVRVCVCVWPVEWSTM